MKLIVSSADNNFFFTAASTMSFSFHVVCSYGGYELIMDAYNVALKEDYRFGTYGDAMLILDK